MENNTCDSHSEQLINLGSSYPLLFPPFHWFFIEGPASKTEDGVSEKFFSKDVLEDPQQLLQSPG